MSSDQAHTTGDPGMLRTFTGELLLPEAAGYEDARVPAVARFAAVRPAAILRCRTADEVAQALGLVHHTQLPVAVRGGGHDFAGRSSTTGLLIDVGAMNSIHVDDNRVVVGPGARLGDLYRILQQHGRTIPAGSGPTVGIAGLTLGGGFGLLGRLHGLTCDNLVSAQVVLLDGRIVRCDHEQEPDLFWLIRGAGATGCGVVTELVFDTIAEPGCTAFELTWNHQHTAQVVTAWQKWAPSAPDALAASLLITAPADPAQPLQSRVLGTLAGDGSNLQSLLFALVTAVGPQPHSSSQHRSSWLDVRTWLNEPRRQRAKGRVQQVRVLPRVATSLGRRQPDHRANRAPAARRGTGTRLLSLGRRLQQSRRRPHRLPSSPRAVPAETHRHRSPRNEDHGLLDRQLGYPVLAIRAVMGSGGVYPNFPDLEFARLDRAYYGSNLGRIKQVLTAYTPDFYPEAAIE